MTESECKTHSLNRLLEPGQVPVYVCVLTCCVHENLKKAGQEFMQTIHSATSCKTSTQPNAVFHSVLTLVGLAVSQSRDLQMHFYPSTGQPHRLPSTATQPIAAA